MPPHPDTKEEKSKGFSSVSLFLLESLGDMEKVRTFVTEIMVDLQQPYKIRHHPNGVFSFTPNLTEGWHTVTHRGLSQRPLSNSSLRCKTINHD